MGAPDGTERDTDMQSDTQLVERLASGDTSALGDLFRIYGDRLHDYCWSVMGSPHDAADAVQDTFLLAAERIGQLRDPNKLRPWLYAIARNECLRRVRDRSTPVDRFDELTSDEDLAEGVQQDELAELVRSAAAGLDPRDRAVLDLQLRHGLEGGDLADALGVKTSHAYVLVGRVRDRVERSLVALLVARRGRRNCEELAALLRNWDGGLTPLLRKRVARHVDDCDICERTRAMVASPIALLAAVPLMPAPAELHTRLTSHSTPVAPSEAASSALSHDSSGFPRAAAGTRGAGWIARVAGAAALVVAGVVLAVGLWPDRDRGGGRTEAVGAPTSVELSSPPSSTPPPTAPSTSVAAPSSTALPPPPATTASTATVPSEVSRPTTSNGPVIGAGGEPSSTTTTSVGPSRIPDDQDGETLIQLPPPSLPIVRFDLIAPEIDDIDVSTSTVVAADGPNCAPTTAVVSATVTDVGSGVDRVEALVTVGRSRSVVELEPVDDPTDGDDPTIADDLFDGAIGPFAAGLVTSGSAGVVVELLAVDGAGNETRSRLVLKLVSC